MSCTATDDMANFANITASTTLDAAAVNSQRDPAVERTAHHVTPSSTGR